jgi:low affinity Fe/Cu permease
MYSTMSAKKKSGFREYFHVFAQMTSKAVGSVWAFLLALGTVLIWGLTGPLFGYSDTWQLVINTSTTIVTFIMVFLIQSTQNRDAKAVHLKLDELIHAMDGARNKMVDLENMSEEELDELTKHFAKVRTLTDHKISDQKKKVEKIAAAKR